MATTQKVLKCCICQQIPKVDKADGNFHRISCNQCGFVLFVDDTKPLTLPGQTHSFPTQEILNLLSCHASGLKELGIDLSNNMTGDNYHTWGFYITDD